MCLRAAERRSESCDREAGGAGDERSVVVGTREGPCDSTAGEAESEYHRRQNESDKEVEAKLRRAEAGKDEQSFELRRHGDSVVSRKRVRV